MIGLVFAGALAYETDQITFRERPLRDALPAANAWMAVALAGAVAETNRETGCRAGADRTREVLATAIVKRTGARGTVPERGAMRQFGFGTFSAWLEESPEIDRLAFREREDIFGGATAGDSVILRYAGPCATILLAGVRLGTDKLDHFFHTGYLYTLRRDEAAAIRFGTRTERTYYGLWTSKAFSYGDLAANEAGYRFYRSLLEPGAVVEFGADGCAAIARPFDFAEWVTPEWDEALNPSVFSRRIERSIQAHMATVPATYCRAWEALGGPAYERELATLPDAPTPYTTRRRPHRDDPYRLDRLCAPGDAAR